MKRIFLLALFLLLPEQAFARTIFSTEIYQDNGVLYIKAKKNKFILSTAQKQSCYFNHAHPVLVIKNYVLPPFSMKACDAHYQHLAEYGYQGILIPKDLILEGYLILDMKNHKLVAVAGHPKEMVRKIKSKYIKQHFHDYYPKAHQTKGEFDITITVANDVELELKIETFSPSFFTGDYEQQMKDLEQQEVRVLPGGIKHHHGGPLNITLGNMTYEGYEKDLNGGVFGLSLIKQSVIAFPVNIDGPILISKFH